MIDNIQIVQTDFALGASVAAVVFGVVYALAAGITIEPLAIPAAVPIEAAAGLLGMLIVIIAALWRSRKQDDSTDSSATETDQEPQDLDDEVRTPQPQPPGEGTTQDPQDSEVDTSKFPNISNGDIEAESTSSTGQPDTQRRTEEAASSDQTERNTSRRTDNNNGGSPTSSNSRRNIGEEDTQNPGDTDNSELPQDYQRQKASFNAGNPQTDE